MYVLQRRTSGFFEDIVNQDVVAAVERVCADSGSDKIVLGGHSAGAGAVLCATLSHAAVSQRVGGLALLSVPHPETGGVARRAGIVFGLALTRAMGRFPAKMLRMSNMDEAETIFNPWLMWHWRGKFGTHLDHGRRLAVPLYSGVGEQDILWAPLHGARKLHEQVDSGSSKSLFATFPGGHGDVVTDIPRARERLW